ncbi:hypothetical protein EDB86DRAFT_2943069, partial [Lactarius hatsudake]
IHSRRHRFHLAQKRGSPSGAGREAVHNSGGMMCPTSVSNAQKDLSFSMSTAAASFRLQAMYMSTLNPSDSFRRLPCNSLLERTCHSCSIVPSRKDARGCSQHKTRVAEAEEIEIVTQENVEVTPHQEGRSSACALLACTHISPRCEKVSV